MSDDRSDIWAALLAAGIGAMIAGAVGLAVSQANKGEQVQLDNNKRKQLPRARSTPANQSFIDVTSISSTKGDPLMAYGLDYRFHTWATLAQLQVYCHGCHRRPRAHFVGWKYGNGRGFSRVAIFKCPRCGKCFGFSLSRGSIVPIFAHGEFYISS